MLLVQQEHQTRHPALLLLDGSERRVPPLPPACHCSEALGDYEAPNLPRGWKEGVMQKKLPPRIEAALRRTKYTGVCPLCKRYLDDHDLLKGKPVCPTVAGTREGK